MKILMRSQSDKEWKLVETAAYSKENELQHLLAESPSLISISDVRENAGSLVVAVQEFPLSIGYIDILAFSAEGDIAIIECKLASNSEAKRKVIGQVLEYGANLWQTTYEELDQGVRLRNGESLAELVEKNVQSPDWDEETFRGNVESALASGNFILIIVVDEINEELTRIVRFMNAGGRQGFDFAALEMRRFHNENSEMLIPRFFGPSNTVKKTPNLPGTKWDEPTFFAELQELHGDSSVVVAKHLLEWSKKKVSVWWGRGKESGSFVPYLFNNEIKYQLFAVWTNGTVEIYFQWLSSKPPFDQEEKRIELLSKLNQIDGINIPSSAIDKRPNIRLTLLAEENKIAQFLKVLDWVVDEIVK